MKKINENVPTNNISSGAIAKFDPLIAPKKQPLRRLKPGLKPDKTAAVTEALVNELIDSIKTKFIR